MPKLESFTGEHLAEFGDLIRGIAREATSMEDAARRCVDLLYDNLDGEDGGRAAALIRLYKTHPYGRLPDELRAFARGTLDAEPEDDTRCLTLLATRGALPEWDDRHRSEGHKAIPLPSVEFVRRLPMVAGLVEHLGLEIADIVRPSKHRIVELAQATYGVFHVPVATGSEYLPAQDFVAEHAIASALGYGGVLFSGDFFAVVIFSRVPVTSDVAETIRILSLATRVALMPFGNRVFS